MVLTRDLRVCFLLKSQVRFSLPETLNVNSSSRVSVRKKAVEGAVQISSRYMQVDMDTLHYPKKRTERGHVVQKMSKRV